jgi:hypothetical protein
MKRKVIIGLFLSAFVLASSLAQAQGARKNNDKGQRGYSQPGQHQNNKGDRGFQRNHHHNDRNVYTSNRGNFRVSFNYGNAYACTPQFPQRRLLFEKGRFYKRGRHGLREVSPPIGYKVDFIPVRKSQVRFHGHRKLFVFKGITYQKFGKGFKVVGTKSC